MSRFADQPIRRKLTIVMGVTTTVALLSAAVALGGYEVLTFRRALIQKLTTIADIVGRNSTAALTFGDERSAKDVLTALGVEPGVEQGALYDRNGKVFASYSDSRYAQVPLPTAPGNVGVRLEGRNLVVVHPVLLDGEPIGTVYLRSTLDELTSRMLVFLLVTLAIVAVCSIIGLLISTRVQHWVSQPILDLARTARTVTSDRNFSLRVAHVGRDEVGTLVDDFNRMLAEIERQDQELRQQQEQLESQVANRTAELRAANDQLVRSMDRVKRYADQIGELTLVGQLMQSCQTSPEVFNVVQHAAHKLFPRQSGALVVLNSSRNAMEALAGWGANPPRQHVFGPEDCWAFRLGRPHLALEADSPLRCAHWDGHQSPATLCVPLMAQGEHIGVLQFTWTPGDEDGVEAGVGTLESTRGRMALALAEQIALALANLRLREALRNQSIIDPLTSLFNRRYVEEVLERECRRAVRANRPLAVMMIDVDHFKQFNDMWGHECGDTVLREMAGLMRTYFRGEDVVCRYGGEEFVVLLADASAEAARERAEQLRTAVQALVVLYRKRTVGSITISVGVSALPEHGVTPENLIEAADRALYAAKAGGRDRTVCASAPAQPSTA